MMAIGIRPMSRAMAAAMLRGLKTATIELTLAREPKFSSPWSELRPTEPTAVPTVPKAPMTTRIPRVESTPMTRRTPATITDMIAQRMSRSRIVAATMAPISFSFLAICRVTVLSVPKAIKLPAMSHSDVAIRSLPTFSGPR